LRLPEKFLENIFTKQKNLQGLGNLEGF